MIAKEEYTEAKSSFVERIPASAVGTLVNGGPNNRMQPTVAARSCGQVPGEAPAADPERSTATGGNVRRMPLKLLNALVVLNLAAAGLVHGQVTSAQPINTSAWLEDFSQLKREMSAHYANLEWAIESRGLDLKQISDRAESRLRQSQTAAEAQATIESFINAFGDAHLGIDWASSVERKETGDNSKPNPPPSLCARLGYQSQTLGSGIVFSRLSGFKEITNEDSKYFSIGVLRLSRNRSVGVLRIGLFYEGLFPDLCQQAASTMGLKDKSSCDDQCEDRVERRTADLLTAALARQVTALKRETIAALLVDITGNGGGNNWVEPAARTLTAKPLRSPHLGFIRHEHWTRQLEERLKVIEADARRASTPRQRLLSRAAIILRKSILESRQTCVREAVWDDRKLTCSLVVSEPLYTSRILPYAKPGELPDTPSSPELFYPSRYSYREGVFSGRLLVLVDGSTGSSAEYFTAMLRDNNAAAILGAPTTGAGCGYTNKGITTVLKNSGAKVKMPDCVRWRADRSNEVAGITPDIMIPWRPNDSRYQKASRVLSALSKLLPVQGGRSSH